MQQKDGDSLWFLSTFDKSFLSYIPTCVDGAHKNSFVIIISKMLFPEYPLSPLVQVWCMKIWEAGCYAKVQLVQVWCGFNAWRNGNRACVTTGHFVHVWCAFIIGREGKWDVATEVLETARKHAAGMKELPCWFLIKDFKIYSLHLRSVCGVCVYGAFMVNSVRAAARHAPRQEVTADIRAGKILLLATLFLIYFPT